MSQRRFIALGTASQVPTRNRNHNGYFLRWDAEGFLFDPGEGTQRQMIRSGVSASDITKIFITHFHGDHCLGLPGVLQRLSLDEVQHPVEVYYPASGRKYFDNLKNASIYHQKAGITECPISREGEIFADENLTIETRRLEHTTDSWGFRLREKDSVTMLPAKLREAGVSGRNIGEFKARGKIQINGRTLKLADFSLEKKGQIFAFVMDTRICPNALELAREADLLVCESTYLRESTKEALERGHLTARQAAEIAREANAKTLVLTHFSQKYQNINDFLYEALEVFPTVVAVKDGDDVDLPGRKG